MKIKITNLNVKIENKLRNVVRLTLAFGFFHVKSFFEWFHTNEKIENFFEKIEKLLLVSYYVPLYFAKPAIFNFRIIWYKGRITSSVLRFMF